jgi:hypothetical protein
MYYFSEFLLFLVCTCGIEYMIDLMSRGIFLPLITFVDKKVVIITRKESILGIASIYFTFLVGVFIGGPILTIPICASIPIEIYEMLFWGPGECILFIGVEVVTAIGIIKCVKLIEHALTGKPIMKKSEYGFATKKFNLIIPSKALATVLILKCISLIYYFVYVLVAATGNMTDEWEFYGDLCVVGYFVWTVVIKIMKCYGLTIYDKDLVTYTKLRGRKSGNLGDIQIKATKCEGNKYLITLDDFKLGKRPIKGKYLDEYRENGITIIDETDGAQQSVEA